MLANQMGMVASGYTAFALTGSATVLGIVSSAASIPMLALSLVGGVVADRSPRRLLIVCSQSAMGLATAAVAVLAFLGWLDVWHLIALGLINGCAFSFNMPARQAYTADLVGSSLLRSAVSLNNAGMNFNRILGPALAGILLVLPGVGAAGTFTMMAVCFAAAVATLIRLPAGQPAGSGLADRPPALKQLVDGLGYIRSSASIRTLLFVALVTLLFGMPYQALMPLFADKVYGAGAQGLGVLNAAVGVGALLGSLAAASGSGSGEMLRRLQLMAGLGFGGSLIAFGLAPTFGFAVAGVTMVGFAWASFMALNATLIMSNTEPGYYGRVMSVYLLTFGFMPVSTIPAGWLADLIGGPPTIVICGVLVLIFLGTASFLPSYRLIQAEVRWAPPERVLAPVS